MDKATVLHTTLRQLQFKEIWRTAAIANGLEINVTGLPSLAAFAFKAKLPMGMNTRFTIEMQKEEFYVSDKENDRVLYFNKEWNLIGVSDKC